mgnify:CR=1 FL=1
MRISFSPQRRDDALEIIKQGDLLTINGEAFDFTGLPDGATLPREAVDCEWLASDVVRVDGDVILTLILPHGPSPSPTVAFPEPLVDPADGTLTIPRDEPEAPADEQD